jgi:hypothetical protein
MGQKGISFLSSVPVKSVHGKVIVWECMFRLQTEATFRVCEEPTIRLVTDMNMQGASGGAGVDLGIDIPDQGSGLRQGSYWGCRSPRGGTGEKDANCGG